MKPYAIQFNAHLYFNIDLYRSITFEAMLKQECGWFDDINNSIGALSSKLSGDAAKLQAVGHQSSLSLIKVNILSFDSRLFLGDWISIQFNFTSDFNVCNWHHRII